MGSVSPASPLRLASRGTRLQINPEAGLPPSSNSGRKRPRLSAQGSREPSLGVSGGAEGTGAGVAPFLKKPRLEGHPNPAD